jgi:hypothetical protein
VPPRDSLNLAARVRAAGGEARTIVYERGGHADMLAGLSSVLRGGSPLVEDITAFIRALPAFREEAAAARP